MILLGNEPSGLLEGVDDGGVDAHFLHRFHDAVLDMLGLAVEYFLVRAGVAPVFGPELLQAFLKDGFEFGVHGNLAEDVALGILDPVEGLVVTAGFVFFAAATGTGFVSTDLDALFSHGGGFDS